MAKGDKFYFDNYKACAELAKKAAAYLVECLEKIIGLAYFSLYFSF